MCLFCKEALHSCHSACHPCHTQTDRAQANIDPVAECTAIQSIIRIVFVVEWALLTLGFVFMTQFRVGMLASYVLSFHFSCFFFAPKGQNVFTIFHNLILKCAIFFSHACFSVLQ